MKTDTHTIIFTDGASRGNPGPAGWGAVLIHEGDRVVELGAGVDRATNNQMELTAIISALAFLEGRGGWKDDLVIYTDSAYAKKGATKWLHGWIHRGWKTADGEPVKNKELWQSLHNLMKTFSIEWQKLPGHSGVAGNVRADAIATRFADGEDPELFDGSIEDYNRIYECDIRDLSTDGSDGESGNNADEPYSYLSLVDGKVKRHQDWKETRERVEGVSGAKFKKAMTPAAEKEILREWGIDPSALSDG